MMKSKHREMDSAKVICKPWKEIQVKWKEHKIGEFQIRTKKMKLEMTL